MFAVLTACGSKNHLDPVLALARQLRQRGHEVALAVPLELEASVASCGLRVAPVGSALFADALFRSGPGPEVSGDVNLQSPVQAQLASFHEAYCVLLETCRGADVLVGAPDDFICAMVHEVLSIPFVSLRFSPLNKASGN